MEAAAAGRGLATRRLIRCLDGLCQIILEYPHDSHMYIYGSALYSLFFLLQYFSYINNVDLSLQCSSNPRYHTFFTVLCKKPASPLESEVLGIRSRRMTQNDLKLSHVVWKSADLTVMRTVKDDHWMEKGFARPLPGTVEPLKLNPGLAKIHLLTQNFVKPHIYFSHCIKPIYILCCPKSVQFKNVSLYVFGG